MQRNRYEMLTDENLIEELRGGDSAITDFIMNKYKPMVRKKARAMFLLGGENEDLIQEGMIGLFKAIRDYETRQGTSFASFAELCVSRQMYSAIEASQRKKHLPLNSYVSLYEESVEEGKKVPLIDTIEPQEENNPEALYRDFFRTAEGEFKYAGESCAGIAPDGNGLQENRRASRKKP